MELKIELANTDLLSIFKGGRLDIFCSRSFIGEASPALLKEFISNYKPFNFILS